MKRALLALCLFASGCAPYVHDLSQVSATGYVDGFTSDDSKKKLGGLATSVVGDARDKALDDDTTKRLQVLVDAMGASLRTNLLKTRDDLLDATLRAEIDAEVARLSDELQDLVRALVDEALGHDTLVRAGMLREELVGAPLRADVDALAPHLSAALQASLDRVKADADAEASKYKAVAIGLGAGAFAMLVALGVVLHESRAHRKAIEALLARV